MMEWGIPYKPPLNKDNNPKTRKQGELIYDAILKGTKASILCAKYPNQYGKIYKLMRFFPPRDCRTDLVMYHGPPGTRKTTMIQRTLKALKKTYGVTYYCKLGGLDKWFDGYDNDDLVWIDDPVTQNVPRTGDESSVQRFKNIISTGDVLVEVKCGSMVFTSPLIIITSNLDPGAIANSCGPDNQEAIYRRLTDTCGSHYIANWREATLQMPIHLLKCIKRNLKLNNDLDIDIERVVHNIADFKAPTYDFEFKQCNMRDYFEKD